MLGRIDEGRKGGEDALDCLIAGRDLLLGKVIEGEGWGEGADMFRPVVPLQRFGNGVLTGFNAIVPLRGEGTRVAFPSHNRSHNAPPRHPGHITNTTLLLSDFSALNVPRIVHLDHRNSFPPIEPSPE